jgi:hypothetical protein
MVAEQQPASKHRPGRSREPVRLCDALAEPLALLREAGY